MDAEELLPLSYVAQRLRLSEVSVKRLADRGFLDKVDVCLPGSKLPRWKITRESFERFVELRTRTVPRGTSEQSEHRPPKPLT